MDRIPNPARGEYLVNLDKPRVMRYDLNSFIAFETATGGNIQDFLASDEPSLRNIRTFIWSGLVHEDKSLTEEEAGRLIDYGIGDNYNDKLKWLFQECGAAFSVAWPQDAKKKEPAAR